MENRVTGRGAALQRPNAETAQVFGEPEFPRNGWFCPGFAGLGSSSPMHTTLCWLSFQSSDASVPLWGWDFLLTGAQKLGDVPAPGENLADPGLLPLSVVPHPITCVSWSGQRRLKCRACSAPVSRPFAGAVSVDRICRKKKLRIGA